MARISKFRFMKLWLADPRVAVAELKHVIEQSGTMKPEISSYAQGDIMLHEDRKNAYLFLLMKGQVALMKTVEDGNHVPVTYIRPGSLFGVLSFFSGKPALTSAVAVVPCEVLKLTRRQVDALLKSGDMADFGRQLIIANLLERYTQVVDLNLQLEQMNLSLEQERERLDDAITELKATQKRLVAQEKMATLGQLVAGIAHEINNPAAALQSSVRTLSELYSVLETGQNEWLVKFYRFGLESKTATHVPSAAHRLESRKTYSGFRQSDIRLVMGMSGQVKEQFEAYRKRNPLSDTERLLRAYETGLLIRSIGISTDRISSLVRSLKSYSRQDQGDSIEVNLAEGLHDTLHILANRLKKIKVNLEIQPVAVRNANAAELNQVWTNIIINACDAMNDSGNLKIECRKAGGKAEVLFHDSGPGVSPENIQRIFEASFTTRNSSGNFGLGLGLAISNDIIRKHGGKIHVEQSEYGGALFRITLPL